MTETSKLALPAQVLQAVDTWPKSDSNEGHFTRKAETVIGPYVGSQGSGVTETIYLVLPAHALQELQVWSKSVMKGTLLLQRQQFFAPLSPRISAGGD
jgi:hypothetical protein